MQSWLNASAGLSTKCMVDAKEDQCQYPRLMFLNFYSLTLRALLEEAGSQPLSLTFSPVILGSPQKHHFMCAEDRAPSCSPALPSVPRVLRRPFSHVPHEVALQCTGFPAPSACPIPWATLALWGSFSKVHRSRWEGLAFDSILAPSLGGWLCIATLSGFMASSFQDLLAVRKRCAEKDRTGPLVFGARQYVVIRSVLWTIGCSSGRYTSVPVLSPSPETKNVSRYCHVFPRGKIVPSWARITALGPVDTILGFSKETEPIGPQVTSLHLMSFLLIMLTRYRRNLTLVYISLCEIYCFFTCRFASFENLLTMSSEDLLTYSYWSEKDLL